MGAIHLAAIGVGGPMTCLVCGVGQPKSFFALDPFGHGVDLGPGEWLCQDCVDAAVRHFREAEPTARRVNLLDWAREKRAEREAK